MVLLVGIFGWVAGVVGMVSGLPQLVRIFQARTSTGVSLLMWQLTLAAMTAWSCHGIHVARLNLQMPNMVLGLTSAAVVVMICRDRGQEVITRLVLPFAAGGALFWADLSFGPVVFGILVSIPLSVGQIAQFRDLRRDADVSGVSGGFLLVNLTVQALWLVWALLAGEYAVAACATVLTVLTGMNVGCYISRMRRAS